MLDRKISALNLKSIALTPSAWLIHLFVFKWRDRSLCKIVVANRRRKIEKKNIENDECRVITPRQNRVVMEGERDKCQNSYCIIA